MKLMEYNYYYLKNVKSDFKPVFNDSLFWYYAYHHRQQKTLYPQVADIAKIFSCVI